MAWNLAMQLRAKEKGPWKTGEVVCGPGQVLWHLCCVHLWWWYSVCQSVSPEGSAQHRQALCQSSSPVDTCGCIFTPGHETRPYLFYFVFFLPVQSWSKKGPVFFLIHTVFISTHVTSGKEVNHSDPQFAQLWNGIKRTLLSLVGD